MSMFLVFASSRPLFRALEHIPIPWMATCDSTIAVETTGDVVMLAPISMDLRLRIVGAVEHGSLDPGRKSCRSGDGGRTSLPG
jgi:hypothetical protein